MEYTNTFLSTKKKVTILLVLSLALTFAVLFLGRGYVSAGGQGNGTLEDGSTYPDYVIERLNGICSSGQPSAQTTFVSLADNLAAGSTTVETGATVELRYSVVTKRCRDGVPTQLVADRFRAKGGVYVKPGGSIQNSIPQLNSVDDIVLQPPAPTGPAYSRGSWTFTVSTAGVTTSGDFVISADSKQFSWREVPAYFMCIMGFPQTLMWGDGNAPPNATEESALAEMERVCPVTSPDYSFRVNVTPPPRFDVRPRDPVINLSERTVSFDSENSGNGESRYEGNVGVLTQTRVWVDGAEISNILHNRAILTPNGGTWSTVRGGVYVFNLPPLSRGNVVCALIRVDPPVGVTGGAPDPIPAREAGGGPGQVTCQTVISKPYFRAYGGDVVVGRNFASGTTCTSLGGGAKIEAWATTRSGNWVGAGGEFAVRATDVIDGFISRSLNGSESPTALSFGNTSGTTRITDFGGEPGSDSGAYGGCIPDYWTELGQDGFAPLPGVSGGEWAGGAAPNGYYYHTGTLTITDNVNLPGNWTNVNDIPRFYLVVKGNINISPDVTNIDGVIIAQPTPLGAGGTINTCATTDWRECDSKLTFNGAVVADTIKLNRTIGDVSDAGANEQPGSGNIAEVFNFLPELYLAEQGDLDIPVSGAAKYDYIIGLPPVL